ncbi:MAG: polymorphic toxin-type HINT domain-containing protein [Verrucomicrobiales bacterium]
MLYNTFEAAVQTYQTGTPGEKGLLTGVIVTEIIAAAMGVAELRQAAKLAKAGQMTRTMEKLIERPVMQAPARQTLCSRLRDKLKAFREWIDPWCFVAGTLVATPAGAVPIESVRAGDLVWSRDPDTFLTEPRPVRETYVSHPAEWFHVGVDRDGDHRADETISGTGSHPWYVLTPGRVGFVPARELQAGDILSLRDGTRAWVADKTREVAPPGQTFTTYNFAVADHHTYVAGQGGVWVHNLCKAGVDRGVAWFETAYETARKNGASVQQAQREAAEHVMAWFDEALDGVESVHGRGFNQTARIQLADAIGNNAKILNSLDEASDLITELRTRFGISRTVNSGEWAPIALATTDDLGYFRLGAPP